MICLLKLIILDSYIGENANKKYMGMDQYL